MESALSTTLGLNTLKARDRSKYTSQPSVKKEGYFLKFSLKSAKCLYLQGLIPHSAKAKTPPIAHLVLKVRFLALPYQVDKQGDVINNRRTHTPDYHKKSQRHPMN